MIFILRPSRLFRAISSPFFIPAACISVISVLSSPDFCFDNVTDIDIDFLEWNGIKAVFLDIDNTLTQHNGTEPYDGVREWVDSIKSAGVKVMIISNAKDEHRVRIFAEKLGIDNYIWDAKKPFPRGFRQLAKDLGVNKSEVLVIGDQLFTDILGANLAGLAVSTALVKAKDKKEPIIIKIKRILEIPIKALNWCIKIRHSYFYRNKK